MDLELPYKLYKLVRADGSLVERIDKHPFCFSRVYYAGHEKPEEVGRAGGGVHALHGLHDAAVQGCRAREAGGGG